MPLDRVCAEQRRCSTRPPWGTRSVVGAMFSSLTPKPGFLGMGMGGAIGTMGVIIGHAIYGLVLGAIYGQPVSEHRSPVGTSESA